jgi:hypothetical protein
VLVLQDEQLAGQETQVSPTVAYLTVQFLKHYKVEVWLASYDAWKLLKPAEHWKHSF